MIEQYKRCRGDSSTQSLLTTAGEEMNSRIMTTLASAGVFAAAIAAITTTPASATAVPQAHVSPNFYSVSQVGYGPTLAAAERDAKNELISNYMGCGAITLMSDSQLADGTWQAWVSATCAETR